MDEGAPTGGVEECVLDSVYFGFLDKGQGTLIRNSSAKRIFFIFRPERHKTNLKTEIR